MNPILRTYVKSHAFILAALALSTVVFLAVFSLYHLPLESVLYASGLSFLILAICGTFRYRTYCQRHRALVALLEDIHFTAATFLEPKDLIESDYQALAERLDEHRLATLTASAAAVRDTSDYYTLWAHQIKTPIAAMGLILQSELSPNSVAELREQIFKVEQYVEMALQYLRTEGMSSDLHIARYMLDTPVRQAVRKYATLFIRKGIHIDLALPNAEIVTDAKWLQFVFEQLLSNAIKYTPSGGTVSIHADPEQAQTVVIADNGIGIREENLPRVFERGFTGYNGHADTKSTGIGLYLCARIIKRLGHTLRIESTVGQGTRVYIGFQAPPTMPK